MSKRKMVATGLHDNEEGARDLTAERSDQIVGKRRQWQDIVMAGWLGDALVKLYQKLAEGPRNAPKG